MSSAKYYDAARAYGSAASSFAKANEVNMSPMLKSAMLMFLIISVLVVSPFRMMNTVGAALKDADEKDAKDGAPNAEKTEKTEKSDEYKAAKMIKDMYTAVGTFSLVSVLLAMSLSFKPEMRSKILMFIGLLMFINFILLIVIMSKIEKAKMKDAVEQPAKTDFAMTIVLLLLLGKLYMENK